MLKMTLDGDMILGELDLTASFIAETILQSYFISPNEVSITAARIIPINTLSNSKINANIIFFGLKKGIGRVQ